MEKKITSTEKAIPLVPVLSEELGQPVAADSTLAVEEPDEIVDPSDKSRSGNTENDHHAGQVAGSTDGDTTEP